MKASVGFSNIPLTDCTETQQRTHTSDLSHSKAQPRRWRLSSHLQLSEGIVTLLLTRSLLGAHGDELVDAVSHSPVDAEEQ